MEFTSCGGATPSLDTEVECVGTLSWEERDAELRKRAISIDDEDDDESEPASKAARLPSAELGSGDPSQQSCEL